MQRHQQYALCSIACGLSDKYDIITESETWLNSKCCSTPLQLQGYQTPFRKDRSDDQGYGGVLAWISDTIAAKRR